VFIKKILVPYFRKNNIKIAEIISDYREIPLSSRDFFASQERKVLNLKFPRISSWNEFG